MKLATISPNAVAECLLCQWKFVAPSRKRKKGTSEPLSQEERVTILEQNILAHLRDVHDRLMLTKDEIPSQEKGCLGKIYYNGRRPERVGF